MSAAPKPGSRVSVRVDDFMSDDLAALMRTGMTASDAIRRAVELLADIHRNAWSAGLYPEGTAPQITLRSPHLHAAESPVGTGVRQCQTPC